ncbi:MAG: hypothetical protein GIW95_09565, partial [Candidatus Eremiobacteraeota bacterium]|nr:hypothetical protein [Candidatus Eremiobacteraeota bacterium]
AYTGLKSNETLTFSRFVQGSLNDTYNLGFVQQLNLAQNLSQTFNFSYSKFNSPLAQSNSLHLSSLTHYFSSIADLNLAYDKSDYSNFSNAPTYDKIPELTILPHFGFKHYPLQPFTAQFSIGEYTEPQNGFSTPRAEFVFNQPVFLKIGKSDFNATYNIRQDFYGTGDAKALDNQTASLTTPLGNHISNSVTYNETHPIGPANVPFQLFDRLSSGSHGLQDVIRFFNSDVYSLSLATSTNFNRQGQPIAYQLNARPSMRSLLVVGGSYVPGPGNGFYQTNVQALTPFGRDTMLQFSGNVDWKRRGKIVNKNIFISKIIGDCYRLDATYNQDLKQFTFNITILAFPNQTLGIGTSNGQPSSILPQNFAF